MRSRDIREDSRKEEKRRRIKEKEKRVDEDKEIFFKNEKRG